MSRIPPHGARMVGAWPTAQDPKAPTWQVPRAAHAVARGVARLGRAVHMLRPAGPDGGPDVAPSPPQHA
ncbi:MAG TPA: hypothetical protein VFG98_03070 [Intrasporangium sp.]|nr:hypothetical protein [Intrasporangium sp.]